MNPGRLIGQMLNGYWRAGMPFEVKHRAVRSQLLECIQSQFNNDIVLLVGFGRRELAGVGKGGVAWAQDACLAQMAFHVRDGGVAANTCCNDTI